MRAKYICILTILILIVSILLVACNSSTREYVLTVDNFEEPTFGTIGLPEQAMRFEAHNSQFMLSTTDKAVANKVVDAQLKLLDYLNKNGVQYNKLTYLVAEYEASFGDSANSLVYLDINSPASYTQVLATFEAMWGEFANYGYLYALSNAIALELGWTTDNVGSVEDSQLQTFFKQNVDTLNLVYPCFTTNYVAQNVVDNCKALSLQLLQQIDWKSNLTKNIDQQLETFYNQVDIYAQDNDIDFERNHFQFAYRGTNLPLIARNKYLEIQLEDGYVDYATEYFGEDYWRDYSTICWTLSIMDSELETAIARADLTDRFQMITMKLYSPETAERMLGSRRTTYVMRETRVINATSIWSYLHECAHCFESYLTSNEHRSWQSQAYCDWVGSESYFYKRYIGYVFENLEKWQKLFVEAVGHEYDGNSKQDLYTGIELVCYVIGDVSLDYATGGYSVDAMMWYLVNTYGEDNALNSMIFINKVEVYIGKSWQQLQDEWKTYLNNKYADLVLPQWAIDGDYDLNT